MVFSSSSDPQLNCLLKVYPVMLIRPGGSFCVFIEKLPLARHEVPIAIYHLLTEVKGKRKLKYQVLGKNEKKREEKVSLLLFPGYSEFHTDRSPDEANNSK